MFSSIFNSPGNYRIRKTCPLIAAAALILPALAYADTDHGKTNTVQYDNKQYRHDDRGNGNLFDHKDRHKVPSTPEANSGLVLLPIAGAVLLLSWRQLTRVKA